ncbi:MAG: hypothetical protein ACRCWY_12655 [Cellulosilyticaceae bacterium]
MDTIHQFPIPENHIHLLNRGKTNLLLATIDLSYFWPFIKSHTHLYAKATFTIPLLENNVATVMIIPLEQTYLVSTINPSAPSVTLEANIPGILDTTSGRVPSGIASIMYYDIYTP